MKVLKSPVVFGFWPCPRPMTKHWGSGQVIDRIIKQFGNVDVVFGKTDGIPESLPYIDLTNGYNWLSLPFEDNYFEFGYWDPPYDRMYKPEGKEIWRICRRLVILHTHIYPTSWFKDAKREGMIAVTMGPLKQIRCLQVFIKQHPQNKMELNV